MARINPSDWRSVEATGAAQREIETLAKLEAALPDAYTVYHGVHWTRVGSAHSMFGEIDFVVVNQAGAMLLIEQKSGLLVEILAYADAAHMIECTKSAITRFIGMGYRRSDIAIVSFRGRERSQLMAYTQIGPHALKTFTGNYDLFGAPVYSDGEVLLETVYRFKGQSAPCVIFTEIDFEDFDEIARRKLFVGATRAKMHLTLVVSERAAARLMEVLG